MIVHTVQFDRPISNAWLIDDHGQLARGLASSTDPADVADTPGSESNVAGEISPVPSDSEAIEQVLSEIASGVNRIEAQTARWKSQIQDLSIGLASMIVTEIIGSSEDLRIARVGKLLSDVLGRTETPVAAFVNPQDFSKLGELLEAVELDVQPDALVEIGECRVDFLSYDLVSNLRHQLEQIKDGLREVLNDA